ncbi:MAG TPA: glycosyltransferase family 1 protein [Polyangiaceae bacterium]|nr:glycosyltransferase family 1 protein [Polyangiaceae bacterium]
MPKVVIDARSVVEKKSGIGNYTEALVRHIVPLAEDVEFTLLRHPAAQKPILEHPRVLELAFEGETKSPHTVFRMTRHLDFSSFDLYHSPADLVPLRLPCPYVVTLHDLMWVERPELASAFLPVRLANGAWYRANFAHAVRGARGIIAISEATKAAIGRVYPRHVHKVSVVHHGMDHARYKRQSAGPRSLLDKWLAPAERFSLIVGQGSPYKNHVGMVRAFVEASRHDREHKLILVRRFSRIDQEMNRLLARPDVRRQVLVVPFVSDAELLALYAHAQMLLFVSHYEGFGLPALEAMSMGTPVLASTAEAVQEITGDGALHVDSRDHAAIVQGIRRLATDPALRDALRSRGMRRTQQFSWQKCAELTLAAYRRALRGPAPG